MILGLPTEVFARLHAGLGLVALAAGLVSALAMTSRRSLPAVTALFLAATALSSLSGFFYPAAKPGPAPWLDAAALVLLGVSAFALYGRRLAGPWRLGFIACALGALYLNVFLGLAQAFRTVTTLVVLAPTETEPPYVAAQAGVLLLFVVVAAMAAFTPGQADGPGPETSSDGT